NRISTKMFKMEWNIWKITDMAKAKKDPKDIELHKIKLEKLMPEIQWKDMDLLDQASITTHRNQARKLLQKRRKNEEQKAIIEAIRQREMSFASNKRWGTIIDSA